MQLIRSAVTGGRKRVTTAGWFWTDDRGVYRFGPVTAGTYYLAVTAEPWYLRGRLDTGLGVGRISLPSRALPTLPLIIQEQAICGVPRRCCSKRVRRFTPISPCARLLESPST